MGYKEEQPTVDRLKELLIGKSIVEATISDEKPVSFESGPTGKLVLSDGTVLKVWGNNGCGGCGAGWYELRELNATKGETTSEGIITNVEVDEAPTGDELRCKTCGKVYCDHEGYYKMFVIVEDKRITLASFEGSDGNGWYGTGWWLRVVV